MIVVNFSTSVYTPGQQRLSKSLGNHKQLMLNDYTSIGSPTHSQSPYEFKVHAIEKAFEFDPVVLWADSSFWLVGDLTKIEDVIKRKGYFMEESGHYCRDWCKPETKKYFRLPDDSPYTMFSAGLLGLDRNNPDAWEWFVHWKLSALDGHFAGSWENHRHDMVCGSIIAQGMGFTYERGGSHMAYIGPGYSEPEKDVCFYLQGL